MASLMHPDSDLGRQWKDKLKKKVHDTAPEIDDVKGDAATWVSEAITSVKESTPASVSGTIESLKGSAPPKVSEAIEAVKGSTGPKVSDALESVKESAAPKMADALDAVKARRDALPTLTELAQSKPSRSLKHISEDVGGAIAGLGELDTPDLKALLDTHVAPRLVELRQRAAHLASDVVDVPSSDDSSPVAQAGKRFTESLAHADRALESWRGAAVGHVESAQTQVRSAGVQAKEGGKNAAASALWLGAAAAVVYGGLLNEQQRQWLNAKTKAIATGTVEVIQDLRGRDGEFPT